MVRGELCAMLTSESEPATLLVFGGVICRPKVLDCPAARVSGNVSPLMLKPAPVKLPCAMVKLAPPELVKVRFCTPVLPTSTLPKLRSEGRRCRERVKMSVVAVSLKKKLGAVLTSGRLPDALPWDVGAN